jgi:hypothetical protein
MLDSARSILATEINDTYQLSIITRLLDCHTQHFLYRYILHN